MEAGFETQTALPILENAAKHIKLKEFQAALELYSGSLAHANQMNNVLVGMLLSLRGLSKSLLNDDEAALQDYEEALKLNSLHNATFIRRGVSLMKLNRYQEACEAFKRGQILEPDNKTISDLLEELDGRISEMKESQSKIKYNLKRRVSQMMSNQDEDEGLLLNFSGLKEIDKESTSEKRSVLFKYGEEVVQVEQQTFGQKENILKRQQIADIQSRQCNGLDPQTLHKQLSREFSDITPNIYSSAKPRRSILRETTHNSSENCSPQLAKRISALSIKSIDGKLIRKSIEVSDKEINFGYVHEDTKIDKEAKCGSRSSLRCTGSILDKKSENIKFQRKDSGFHKQLKIDGNLIMRSRDPSSESSHSSDEKASSSKKLEQSDTPKITRKESILKGTHSPLLKSKHSVNFNREQHKSAFEQPQL